MASGKPAECLPDDLACRGRDPGSRHPVAFAASVAAHALILAALMWFLPRAEQPQHQWVLAYLVDFGPSGAGAPAHAASVLKSQSVISSLKPHAHRSAAHTPAMPVRAALPQPAAIAATPGTGAAAIAAQSEGTVPPSAGTAASGTTVASLAKSGVGPSGGAGGHGDGGVGSGSSFAHVEYGMNPTPIYPVEARRRAQHGTVLLRIHVAADGSVERVEVARSSGFDLLDDSALDTVRTRWRFIAARREGVAVASWCEVPIRFALTEAQAN